VPVLLVHGEWDADTPAYMSQALFARLTGAPLKRYVVIGEGTHSIMMERNRMQLFREVQLFLDEAR
jgi:alpha-beta hydrolase superfamily lysophospholipase